MYHRIQKVKWPANSPDFNPIEWLWALMKRSILRRRDLERAITCEAIIATSREECDWLSLEEISKDISQLPTIMRRCVAVIEV